MTPWTSDSSACSDLFTQAWFTLYLLFVLNDRAGIRLSRAAIQALSLQPLPLPLPFPNFGRNKHLLVEVIESHQPLFSVQTESDFLEQPITLERAFFGFARYVFLDFFEEFQTRFLNQGWNAFFARRTIRVDFQDHEGPLQYFGQILDPVPSVSSSIEKLRELAFTYPFPNIYSSNFMAGRGADFLMNLVTSVSNSHRFHRSQRGLPQGRQFGSEGPSSYSNRSPQQRIFSSSRRPHPRFNRAQGTFTSPPRPLPLAMIPMTRSRRRDQQVLAQTGFGPTTLRVGPYHSYQAVPPVDSEYLVTSFPYRSLHRRSRPRPPLPVHILDPQIQSRDNNPNNPGDGTEGWIRGSESPDNEESIGLQPVGMIAERENSPPGGEDESMIIVRVERDGQSARVLIDSNDSTRRGRRVPSLQQDLGGIMDPDECTICKGSWSWIKGNTNGAQQSSPADWRLVRLPCKHTYHEECLARWFLISYS